MRKVTALLLAGALSLGTAVPALADNNDHDDDHKGKGRFESEYKDWEREFWANESLARMITKGVIKGDGDGTIASTRPVSRLEAAIMLSRLLDLEAPEVPQGEFKLKAPWGEIEIENKGDKFELKIKTREGEFKVEDDDDIPAWGRDAILIGLREGFLIFDGASLSPTKPLNRLEAAMMMVKAAGLDAEAQAKAGADLDFKDEKSIPERLRGYIAIAVEKGFVNGYENGTFQPHKTLTRAEWAALLDRLDRNGPSVSPDGRQIKGTVTAVSVGSAPSVTMTTPVFPNGVTYPVDDTAVFYENGKEITIADLEAQDQVIINLSTEREILMVTVHNVARQVSGTVTAVVAPTQSAAGSIIVTSNGAATTYTVDADTAVILGSAASTFSEVQVGDVVNLTLQGAHLKKIAIKVEAATVSGELTAITPGRNNALPTLSVVASGNEAATYTVADHATIKRAGGAEITLADLEVGDTVTLRVERQLITAITVNNVARQVSGTVTAFRAPTQTAITPGINNARPTLAVVGSGNVATTYTVADHATIKRARGAAITLADLHVGDTVTLRVERQLITAITVTATANQQ